MKANKFDVLVYGGGSVYIVVPKSPAAKEWVADNVSEERQSWGSGFAVEHRYIDDLVTGMVGAGLEVEGYGFLQPVAA